MIRGTSRILAEHMRYQQSLNKAEASGDVQLHRGDDLAFYTDQLHFDLEAQLGDTGKSRFTVADRGRGDAEHIEILGPDLARLHQARYTTCREGQDDWFLKVDRLDID